jgi:hypothetical protein
MRLLLSAGVVAGGLLAFAGSASAQQVEVFNVVGSNPGSTNADYRGKVGITQTGDTWQIEWRVGNTPVRGTGLIMDKNYMAATGVLQGVPFVFIMRKDGNRFIGEWTVQGQTKIGREIWTPE